MFVPSKTTLPIPYSLKNITLNSLKNITPIENMRYCDLCQSFIYGAGYIVAAEIPDNTYRLEKNGEEQRLKYVCPKCRRWRGFHIGNFLCSFGYLPKKKRYEWDQIKIELYAKYPKHIARFLYKELRRERNRIIEEYDWERYFGKGTVALIWEEIGRLTEGYDCVDNVRVANIHSKNQIRKYNKQKDEGCCGSFDTVVGNWMIGFNYGH